MTALLICLLWSVVYAIVALVVIEIILWVLGQFGVGLPANIPPLLRLIAALIFIIYTILCLSRHLPSP